MLLTVNGLVVRTLKLGDFDRLVTVITETEGKLTFKACGINSLKNKNSAACALFTYSEFVLKKNGDSFYLSRSSPLFFPLRRGCDLLRLSLAGYFTQLAADTSYDRESTAQVLKLLTNALVVISKNDREPDLIKAVFELRLLTALGFAPLLDGCGVCGCEPGGKDGFFFDPLGGDIVCPDCAKEDGLKISRDCVLLMKRSVESDEKSAYAVTVSGPLLEEFADVSERFLLAQLEKRYDTLDFYREAKELTKK
ncbi:MAG: DNA repair protein RecO [Clostridia bacterium]|nr:DNA repair protein RecO [Clostridia bacterium]